MSIFTSFKGNAMGGNDSPFFAFTIKKPYTDASKRFANYTTLPPGTYPFRVKGSNQDDDITLIVVKSIS